VLSVQQDTVLLIKRIFPRTDLICKEIKKQGQDTNKCLGVSELEYWRREFGLSIAAVQTVFLFSLRRKV